MNSATPGSVASLGERFNPLAGDQLEDPFHLYAEARREEPVFFSPAFHMWVVTSYRDARMVLASPTIFSSRDSITPIFPICSEALAVLGTGIPPTPVLVNSDPPAHDRFRKVLKNAFSTSRMRLLEPQIREDARARIEGVAPAGRAEVMEELAYPIPLQAIARLFDVGDETLDDLKRWSQSYIALISSAPLPDEQVRIAQDLVDFQRFMQAHIDRKRAEPGPDVVSEMIAGGGDRPFSTDELVTQLTGLLLAGHETTTNFIGTALYLLLSERSRWEELVAKRTLIPAAVEEVLRFDSSVPTFLRTATAGVELGGKQISAGDRVLVVFASADRDAEAFSEPDVFDLHRRSDNPHMGFGYGIHYCVGAPLARLQGRVVLDELARQLPTLRLAGDHQELRHVPILIFRGFERLEAEWDVG